MAVRRSSVLTLFVGVVAGYFIAFVDYNLGYKQRLFTNSNLIEANLSYHPLWNYDEFRSQHEPAASRVSNSSLRLICFVVTHPENHRTKAKAVKDTWATRCDTTVFVSSQTDATLNTVVVSDHEGRDYLWLKTKHAFQHLYDHYKHQGDWFLKADDDTYVVVENLRYLLSSYNESFPIWFGRRSRMSHPKGYMSGGSGYVLSRKALEMFVTQALPSPYKCHPGHDGDEDVHMGRCLHNIGVYAGDSRDSFGRERFFPMQPEHHLIPGFIGPKHWLRFWNYYPFYEGLDCCSDTAISFHYVPASQIYELDYLLYHLKPVGLNHKLHRSSLPPPDTPALPPQAFNKISTVDED